MDYVMPRADLVREFRTAEHIRCRRPNNPLGAKGAGEAGTTGALPTCMNAVIDALRSAGVSAFRHAGDAGAALGGDRRRAVTTRKGGGQA